MISQNNHVAPMQMPEFCAETGIVSKTSKKSSPAPPTTPGYTVFPNSHDSKAHTKLPDLEPKIPSEQANIKVSDNEPSSSRDINIKDSHSRTNHQHKGGSVVCFLKDNVVTANTDMNGVRKFRVRRRVFVLTIMTIGFFTTMVYSLLFTCCTVIPMNRSALPTRLGSENQVSSSSILDISLPASDRVSLNFESEKERSVSKSFGIGPSEMLIVAGRFVDKPSVLDREYYRRKIGSRTILLASSSDSFPLPESSVSNQEEFPRLMTLDISHRQTKSQTHLPKESPVRLDKVTHTQDHRDRLFREMQAKELRRLNLERQTEKQKTDTKEVMLEAHNPSLSILHFWQRNFKKLRLSKKKDISSNSLKESEYEKLFTSSYTPSKGPVVNDLNERGFVDEVLNQWFVSTRNIKPQQMKQDDGMDSSKFIGTSNVLPKTEVKTKSSADNFFTKSQSPLNLMQQGSRQNEQTITTSLSSSSKETSQQSNSFIFPLDTRNKKSNGKDYKIYYTTGTRDINAMNTIGTSHLADSQIDIDSDSDDSEVAVSEESFSREANDRDNVIYAEEQEDYYYIPGDLQQISRSETKPQVAIPTLFIKEQTDGSEGSVPHEHELFVDSRVKNNDSYFEYRDDEDGDDVDYYEEELTDNKLEKVQHKIDANEQHKILHNPKHNNIKHTRTSSNNLVSLSPSFSLSDPNKDSETFRKDLANVDKTTKETNTISVVPAIKDSSTLRSTDQHRLRSVLTKNVSISPNVRKPLRDLLTSQKNQSSPLSITSVLASVSVNSGKSEIRPPFKEAGRNDPGLTHGLSSPSSERTEQIATKKLPQAIIIGVKKGGTRAVLEFLRLHPKVRAPGPEPHFFDRHYQKGFDWYRNKMPATLEGQITIEKTPSYFVTKDVPRRIFDMSRDIKLIVVVRDPVTRAISDYTQTVSKRAQVRSFEQMVFINNTRIVDTSWGAIRIGVYAKHVSLWLRFFNLSQIHFVNGERLITDPAGEMAELQDFLGLDRFINRKHFYFNETKGFPCLKKPEGSGHPHCLGKTKGRTHPIISQKVLKRLRDFYRPFNSKFYQLVQKDFKWS